MNATVYLIKKTKYINTIIKNTKGNSLNKSIKSNIKSRNRRMNTTIIRDMIPLISTFPVI